MLSEVKLLIDLRATLNLNCDISGLKREEQGHSKNKCSLQWFHFQNYKTSNCIQWFQMRAHSVSFT